MLLKKLIHNSAWINPSLVSSIYLTKGIKGSFDNIEPDRKIFVVVVQFIHSAGNLEWTYNSEQDALRVLDEIANEINGALNTDPYRKGL